MLFSFITGPGIAEVGLTHLVFLFWSEWSECAAMMHVRQASRPMTWTLKCFCFHPPPLHSSLLSSLMRGGEYLCLHSSTDHRPPWLWAEFFYTHIHFNITESNLWYSSSYFTLLFKPWFVQLLSIYIEMKNNWEITKTETWGEVLCPLYYMGIRWLLKLFQNAGLNWINEL